MTGFAVRYSQEEKAYAFSQYKRGVIVKHIARELHRSTNGIFALLHRNGYTAPTSLYQRHRVSKRKTVSLLLPADLYDKAILRSMSEGMRISRYIAKLIQRDTGG